MIEFLYLSPIFIDFIKKEVTICCPLGISSMILLLVALNVFLNGIIPYEHIWFLHPHLIHGHPVSSPV
jgi:hypothetical protein